MTRTRRRRSPGPAARVVAFARTVDPASVDAEPAEAQAYCGPGHGRRWSVESGDGPADVVQLQTTRGACSYRLLLHPRSHGPARDHQGRYSYVPVAVGGPVAPSGVRAW
jgi:hypothetical protein